MTIVHAKVDIYPALNIRIERRVHLECRLQLLVPRVARFPVQGAEIVIAGACLPRDLPRGRNFPSAALVTCGN